MELNTNSFFLNDPTSQTAKRASQQEKYLSDHKPTNQQVNETLANQRTIKQMWPGGVRAARLSKWDKNSSSLLLEPRT